MLPGSLTGPFKHFTTIPGQHPPAWTGSPPPHQGSLTPRHVPSFAGQWHWTQLDSCSASIFTIVLCNPSLFLSSCFLHFLISRIFSLFTPPHLMFKKLGHPLSTTHCALLYLSVSVGTLTFPEDPPGCGMLYASLLLHLPHCLFLSCLLHCELLQHLDGSET